MAKTIVGLYDSQEEAQQVVQDLIDHGIPRDEVSLAMPHPEGATDNNLLRTEGVAVESESEDGEHTGLGAALGGLGGLLVGFAVLTIPVFGPIIAAGPLATVIAGTTVGAYAGAIAGGLKHFGVSEERAQHYAERVHQGEILIVVKPLDELVERAETIMSRHHPVDLHERSSD
jgi:hypothetical protein